MVAVKRTGNGHAVGHAAPNAGYSYMRTKLEPYSRLIPWSTHGYRETWPSGTIVDEYNNRQQHQ